MENGVHHILKQYTHSLTDPVVVIALYRKMQRFGATLAFDLHFFVFNGIIRTILVEALMKTSRACTGVLSTENDDFKFLKTSKT